MTEVDTLAREVVENGYDALATRSVDEAVANGHVDGLEQRVAVSWLVQSVMEERAVPKDVFAGFSQSLNGEDRFVDRIKSMYGFRPELSPDSTVEPSLEAIVAGRAIFANTERAAELSGEALGYMDSLAQAVIDHQSSSDGVISIREVSTAIQAGGHRVSFGDFVVFQMHMRQDPRFHTVGDGRIVLNDVFEGNVEDLAPLTIPDMPAQIYEALSRVVDTDHAGKFATTVLQNTMRIMGNKVRPSDLGKFRALLDMLPYIRVYPDGRLKIKEFDRLYPEGRDERKEQAEPVSLDAKLAQAGLGGKSRTRYRKR